jgi:hypothetical protein
MLFEPLGTNETFATEAIHDEPLYETASRAL